MGGVGASMFWAGALMAFVPLVAAGTVLAVWWYTRRRQRDERGLEQK